MNLLFIRKGRIFKSITVQREYLILFPLSLVNVVLYSSLFQWKKKTITQKLFFLSFEPHSLAFSMNSRWRIRVMLKIINHQSKWLSCLIHVRNVLLIRISLWLFNKHTEFQEWEEEIAADEFFRIPNRAISLWILESIL